MANEENLKPFKTGYDPRREGNGRKKGSKNIKTQLMELLAAKDPDGEWSKLPAAQLIKKAFVSDDLRALQEILDRIEGKVLQKNEVSSEVKYTQMSIIRIEEKPLKLDLGEDSPSRLN